MERRLLLRRHKSFFSVRYPISLKQGVGNHPLLSVSAPCHYPRTQKNLPHPNGCGRFPKRAPEGIRTPNLLIRSQMLYPLSYGRIVPTVITRETAEARGFEPPVPISKDNSLAVSPIRPLWHASTQAYASSRQHSEHHTSEQNPHQKPLN